MVSPHHTYLWIHVNMPNHNILPQLSASLFEQLYNFKHPRVDLEGVQGSVKPQN